jgi:hypothetical protein
MDNQDIERFVKNTLSCTCPQGVFRYIDCRSDVDCGSGVLLDYEINVGRRLLIFVARVDERDSLARIISELVQAGVRKRDENRFNRFRLVLRVGRPDDVTEGAFAVFRSLETDERTHLHVIGDSDFPREPYLK